MTKLNKPKLQIKPQNYYQLLTVLFAQKSKYATLTSETTAMTTCGHVKTFDLVLVTIPAPQFLADILVTPTILAEKLKKLEKIRYSNRFALCCFYNANLELPTAHVASYTYPGGCPWIGKK